MIRNAFYDGFYKAAGARQILGNRAYSEILKQHIREKGLVGSVADWAGKKLVGKKKMFKLQKALNKPALEADTALGNAADKVMRKMPFGKNLFKQTEQIKHGPKHLELVDRPSITAPLVKATDIAKPIVFGLATDKMIRGIKDKRNEHTQEISRGKTAPATF
jgi:hypothetical protein